MFFMEPNECPATFAAKLVSMRRYVYPSAPFRGIVEGNLRGGLPANSAYLSRSELSVAPGGPKMESMKTGRSQSAAPRCNLPAIVEAMTRPEMYPNHPRSVEMRQTHVSYVFLAGD